MKKLLLFLCMVTLLFPFCKVVKFTPDKLPDKQIIFGDGGGFTGAKTTYTLLENGQIFKQSGKDGAYEELRSISTNKARELFSQVASLQLYKMDIEKPGNIYYYLREVNETIDSQVTWGAGDYLPPRSIIVTYKELHAVVTEREELEKKNQALVNAKAVAKEEKKKKSDW